VRCVEWAGIAVGTSAALAALALLLHWRTQGALRELRAVVDRGTAAGLARLADELAAGHRQISATRTRLESLAIAIAGPEIEGTAAGRPPERPHA
jgi:hypothetical protein